jgi:hypothetical protein
LGPEPRKAQEGPKGPKMNKKIKRRKGKGKRAQGDPRGLKTTQEYSRGPKIKIKFWRRETKVMGTKRVQEGPVRVRVRVRVKVGL